MKDTFYQVRLVTFQQNSRFPVRQSLAQSRFFNQLFNQDTVILIVLRIFQRIQNLLMMDKLFCFDESFGISYILCSVLKVASFGRNLVADGLQLFL